MWISEKDLLWLKAEYFDEDNELVNTEILSDIKKMDDRIMPTHLEMIPADKPGQKTIMVFENIKFNIPIKESFLFNSKYEKSEIEAPPDLPKGEEIGTFELEILTMQIKKTMTHLDIQSIYNSILQSIMLCEQI